VQKELDRLNKLVYTLYMENIICTTPEQIAFFQLCSLRGALRLEAAGMKRRGPSALSIAKKQGFKARTAREAVELVHAKIKEITGE
jgi:hypothetical protein